MTRKELHRQATAELERRRQAAETAAMLRRDEICAALPELLLLEQKQAEAGATAGRLAAEGRGDDARLRLAEVRDIKKRKEQLLAQNGLSLSDLEPKYVCPECRDSGRTRAGRMCDCLLQEVRRLRRAMVNEASPLKLCRFENFRLDLYPDEMPDVPVSPRGQMEQILQACKDYAADFGPYSGSLFMYGDAGLGKTHLALSIASEVLDKGYDVIYVSSQSAFATISDQRFDKYSELMDSMLEADLLVLDDLGTEYMDAYVLSKLYELVNARQGKPTIYTSNIYKREVLETRYTEKVSSRLLSVQYLMRFFGKDIRLLRK